MGKQLRRRSDPNPDHWQQQQQQQPEHEEEERSLSNNLQVKHRERPRQTNCKAIKINAHDGRDEDDHQSVDPLDPSSIAPSLAPKMPPRLTFEYNPLSYAYPDDESDKELFLQASATLANHLRPVLIYWVNMVFSDGEEVWQVVRLDHRDNIYKYVYPDLIVVDECERQDNVTFSLGVFSRDQREALLECADDVEYDERPTEQGQCSRWMGQLLNLMRDGGLVERTVVDTIKATIPLP